MVKNPPANAGEVGSVAGSEDPLEKDMATQASILAWKIPWTEGPGALQTMGSPKRWTQLSNRTRTTAKTGISAAGGAS